MEAKLEAQKSQLEIVNKVPLWLAVAITVAISIPLTYQLGRWNVPLWASYIAWAEYFALGANAAALKKILVCFAYGSVAVGLWLTTSLLLGFVGLKPMGMWALIIANFIWVSIAVWGMKFHPILQEGSLALFNGLAVTLAVFFTGSASHALSCFTSSSSPYLGIWFAVIWSVIAAYIGAILGWFNILITFPHTRSAVR